jgi:hypothetical protein
MLCIYGASSRFRTADPSCRVKASCSTPELRMHIMVEAVGVEPTMLCKGGGFTVHWGYQFFLHIHVFLYGGKRWDSNPRNGLPLASFQD